MLYNKRLLKYIKPNSAESNIRKNCYYIITVQYCILLYLQQKGVNQKYSQFISHLQQDTVIWNALTTL